LRLLVATVANAVALLATTVVPGIRFQGNVVTLLVAGALFGVFNFFVRPLALLLSVPLLVLTLGLFYLVLNGILLWLASYLLPGYSVSGIFAGVLGSLVIAVLNWAFHAAFGDGGRRGRSAGR
jgi:putative membrane protein